MDSQSELEQLVKNHSSALHNSYLAVDKLLCKQDVWVSFENEKSQLGKELQKPGAFFKGLFSVKGFSEYDAYLYSIVNNYNSKVIAERKKVESTFNDFFKEYNNINRIYEYAWEKHIPLFTNPGNKFKEPTAVLGKAKYALSAFNFKAIKHNFENCMKNMYELEFSGKELNSYKEKFFKKKWAARAMHRMEEKIGNQPLSKYLLFTGAATLLTFFGVHFGLTGNIIPKIKKSYQIEISTGKVFNSELPSDIFGEELAGDIGSSFGTLIPTQKVTHETVLTKLISHDGLEYINDLVATGNYKSAFKELDILLSMTKINLQNGIINLDHLNFDDNIWSQKNIPILYDSHLANELNTLDNASRYALSIVYPYIGTIMEELSNHRFPNKDNSFLLPFIVPSIESIEGNIYSISKSNAAGLFQFKVNTAREYGLHIDETFQRELQQEVDLGYKGPQAIIRAVEDMSRGDPFIFYTLLHNLDNLDERFQPLREVGAAVAKLGADLRSKNNDVYKVLTYYNSGHTYLSIYDHYGSDQLIDQSFAERVGFPIGTSQYMERYAGFENSLLSNSREYVNELLSRPPSSYDEIAQEVINTYEDHLLSLAGYYRYHYDDKISGSINRLLSNYNDTLTSIENNYNTQINDSDKTASDLQSFIMVLENDFKYLFQIE